MTKLHRATHTCTRAIGVLWIVPMSTPCFVICTGRLGEGFVELPAHFFATSCEPVIISESLKIIIKGRDSKTLKKKMFPGFSTVTSFPPPLFLDNHWVPAAISRLSCCCCPSAPTPQTPLHSFCIPHHSTCSYLWPLLCLERLSSSSLWQTPTDLSKPYQNAASSRQPA